MNKIKKFVCSDEKPAKKTKAVEVVENVKEDTKNEDTIEEVVEQPTEVSVPS